MYCWVAIIPNRIGDTHEEYWTFVRDGNIALERELNDLRLEEISKLDAPGWSDFLHDKYFRWNARHRTGMPLHAGLGQK